MSDIDIISNLDNEKFEEKPINLINIYKTIARNKILYFMITGSTIFASLILAFAIKKVWGGQFQIVINEKNKSTSISPQLANLAGIDIQKGNALNTQVEILKSPSVLMPVFDFYKSNNNQNDLNNLRFKKWKENLRIELEDGTSVLNLSYLDKNKKIIIPVLNKISTIYQSYLNNRKNIEIIPTKIIKLF